MESPLEVSIDREDVTLLILEYLHRHGHIRAMRALEKETGKSTTYDGEASFLRSLILDGCWDDAKTMIKPLERSPVEYERALFEMDKQQYLEMLEAMLQHKERERKGEIVQELEQMLKSLERKCSQLEFHSLCFCLTLPTVGSHPDFQGWTKYRGRLRCFNAIAPHITLLFPWHQVAAQAVPEGQLEVLCEQAMHFQAMEMRKAEPERGFPRSVLAGLFSKTWAPKNTQLSSIGSKVKRGTAEAAIQGAIMDTGVRGLSKSQPVSKDTRWGDMKGKGSPILLEWDVKDVKEGSSSMAPKHQEIKEEIDREASAGTKDITTSPQYETSERVAQPAPPLPTTWTKEEQDIYKKQENLVKASSSRPPADLEKGDDEEPKEAHPSGDIRMGQGGIDGHTGDQPPNNPSQTGKKQNIISQVSGGRVPKGTVAQAEGKCLHSPDRNPLNLPRATSEVEGCQNWKGVDDETHVVNRDPVLDSVSGAVEICTPVNETVVRHQKSGKGDVDIQNLKGGEKSCLVSSGEGQSGEETESSEMRSKEDNEQQGYQQKGVGPEEGGHSGVKFEEMPHTALGQPVAWEINLGASPEHLKQKKTNRRRELVASGFGRDDGDGRRGRFGREAAITMQGSMGSSAQTGLCRGDMEIIEKQNTGRDDRDMTME
ncbi:unnamed protein product, partial [Discosporangium mesarthrocarpum]